MEWNGDAGGGTMSSICSVSPSDQIGSIDNILSRLEQLEQEVAELKAQNTLATQLSDFSQDAGWIQNVTYMGVAGWTQTPAGTLIPPQGTSLSSLGILMSDGNPFQSVTFDSDGVLQFGFGRNGSVGGTGGKGFIEFDTDGTSTLGNLVSPFNSVLDIKGTVSPWFDYTISSSPQMKFKQAGVYMVNYQAWVIGSDSMEYNVVASFGQPTGNLTDALCFGASVTDMEDKTQSYINMCSVFEMPNHEGYTLNTFFSYLPYIEGHPLGGGVHDFDTVASSLRITKLV